MTESEDLGNAGVDQGCFAICERSVERLVEFGINELTTYVVLAAGTGRDHSTTAWSAQAVEKYTGLRWRRAKKSIDSLYEHGFIENKSGPPKKPRYKLATPKEFIWLPKTFVVGATTEQPPLQRLRQIQDVNTMYLALWIYANQNLVEDWGISREWLRCDFISHELKTWSEWRIVGFKEKREASCNLPDPWGAHEEAPWHHMRKLIDCGLIEWTAALFEGPNGEPIHPLAHDDFSTLGDALNRFKEAAATLIDVHEFDYVMPVPRHLRNVQLTQIARTRYRAPTDLTRQWFAEYAQAEDTYAARYEAIARTIVEQAA